MIGVIGPDHLSEVLLKFGVLNVPYSVIYLLYLVS